MPLFLAALLLLAAQPGQTPREVEPLEPRGCGAFWSMLFFDSGSARLSDTARAILDNLLAALRSNPYTSRVGLTGHADRVGSPEANLLLARRRALAARDYLVAHGLARTLIDVAARPETEMLVDTDDGVAERQNRNVQILEQVPAEIIERENAWIRIHGPYRGPVC
jgi:outer membrane protein OmpA-like peptidoglycan-associated protein